MILKLFSVYDNGVKAYMQPFFVRSKGEAMRSWGDTVNDPKTAFYKHPQDFTLFELGEYDDETGKITNLNTPASCGTALDFRKPEQGQELPDAVQKRPFRTHTQVHQQ